MAYIGCYLEHTAANDVPKGKLNFSLVTNYLRSEVNSCLIVTKIICDIYSQG